MNKRKLKIVFIGGYQGKALIANRGIVRNRSLAGTNKIETICSALALRGHKLTIYSEGRAAERTCKWYAPIQEKIKISEENNIDVLYGATIDVPVLSGLISIIYLLLKFPALFNREKFDAAFVYNCNLVSLAGAIYCGLIKKVPVILEYEDSIIASRARGTPLWKRIFRLNEIIMARAVKGVYAPSPELTDALGIDNKLLVPGALSEALVSAALSRKEHTKCGGRLKLLYCGNLDQSKGVDLLMDAVGLLDYPLEVHICGKGPLELELKKRCDQCKHPAHFHGLVSNQELMLLQTSADIAVNPHRVSLHRGTLWPFKVVEYLACCGVVICAKTGKIEKSLANRLHLYESDDPNVIADIIENVIKNWAKERVEAPVRMKWAIGKWGPLEIGKSMEQLLSNAGLDVDFPMEH